MASPADSAQAYQWRHGNIGRLLNMAVQRFEKRVLEVMAEAGYDDVSLSQVAITRNLDAGGTRATEIAKRAGITKQSVGELIGQLEAIGLVERVPDPDDKRARIVHFTPAGLAWLKAFEIAIKQSEQEMREELGATTLEHLKQGLMRYGSGGDASRGH
ncbi:DNA-binding transcriptional regulator, MarR family [Pseudoduganella namucuonensis]|uniref:DNA-binding transcriptional regulator, MarR family n=2 Tax=Pseudoduganella namucuonensis TaxID=1035707 RepID=A0A1I7G498_9BURK|nr:DNA-binding transcriptional regulator, MarR family [Pseudoduganella namucuonensis]